MKRKKPNSKRVNSLFANVEFLGKAVHDGQVFSGRVVIYDYEGSRAYRRREARQVAKQKRKGLVE